MPYSGFHHQMAKGKLESTQVKMTNYSNDVAFAPDNELVELVWANGQILLQGQSNRTQKSPSCNGSSPHASNDQEKDKGETVPAKIENFGSIADSILNDFSTSGPSGQMGLGQEDELAHWLNYPFDDYSSEFFSELSGVNLNEHSAQNNGVMIDKNSSNAQMVIDSYSVPMCGSSNPDLGNASKVLGEDHKPSVPISSERKTSLPSHRSRISDFTASNTNSAHQVPCGNSTQNLISTGRPLNTKMQKQTTGPSRPPLLPSNNTGFMNFSHFFRPSALSKANVHSIGTTAGPDSSNIDRFRSNDKLSVVGSSNPVESMVTESPSGSRSITDFRSQPYSIPGKVDLRPSMGKLSKEPLYADQSEAVCREDNFRKNRSPDQIIGQASSFAASAAIARSDSEKGAEPGAASSSACSDYSAGGASNDPKHLLKRKSQDTEEFEYPTEDVEEESVARKSTSAQGSTSTKRSRAAEVHNLSERRRRDRINEKMRALQELIPNCNKVDKASMLDEAIEYLKTLQLQVQIMSMGTGLCMPPMMLSTGMQHIHAAHMAYFSPMGVGMGMGMGIGTGMLEINEGSSGCPLIQVPPMHGTQFPCPPISGPSSFPAMTGSGLQMFGRFPAQGLPMLMPRTPFVPLSGGPSTKSVSLPVVSGAATHPVEILGSDLPSISKDPVENINSSQMAYISAECSQNQTSNKCQATKESFTKSPMVQENDHTPQAKRDGEKKTNEPVRADFNITNLEISSDRID